ncbi:MAG: molybdenum cofactor biosynthesis protein MoaE [Chitinophagaceae bacterium]|nr:MAG: molybdenum cofactor biosynthesis protein MoaE [Chitinophagaceae bacterium]
MTDLKISSEPLDIISCIGKVKNLQCGGMDIFIGTIRNKTKEKKVVRLEYEAYEPMALKEMKKIAEYALQLWPVENILIHHRVGVLKTGDIAVIVAVCAPHREAAFDACRYAIDTLKKTVPIWKKEVFEDGEEWVAAHA